MLVQTSTNSRSQRFSTGLRLTVSLFLVGILIERIGIESILGEAQRIQVYYLFLPLSLILLDTLVRTCCWHVLLRVRFPSLSFRTISYSYVVGMFVGSLLPSTLSTDLARILILVHRGRVPAEPCAAVAVAVNLCGLAAVCVWGAFGSLSLLRDPHLAQLVALVLAFAFFVLGGLGLAVMLADRLSVPERLRDLRGLAGKIIARLSEFAQVLKAFANRRRVLGVAFVLILASVLLDTLTTLIIAKLLGSSVTFWQIATLGLVTRVISMLPISIAGFGGEQAAFVVLLSFFNVPSAQGFVISTLVYTLHLAFSLVGGVIYAAGVIHEYLESRKAA